MSAGPVSNGSSPARLIRRPRITGSGPLLVAASLLLGAPGWAEDSVVLHDGEVGLAVEAVLAADQRPAWELAPISLNAALQQVGVVVGGPEPVRLCAGLALAGSDLRQRINQLDGLVSYLELDKARKSMDEIAVALPCLREPAEATALARLFLLQGVVYEVQGDAGAALASFIRAQASQPGLAYDARLPPASSATWARAAAVKPSAELVVIGPSDRLWLDGRPVSGSVIPVTAGLHFLQRLGGPSRALEVEVKEGSSVLVAVEGVTGAAWVDSLQRPGGSALLSSVATTTPAYLVHEGRVWKGPGEWVALPPSKKSATKAVGRRGQVLLGSGISLLVVGAAGAVGGYAWGYTHQETTSEADFKDAERAYGLARGYTTMSLGLVGVGVGLTSAGVIIGSRP